MSTNDNNYYLAMIGPISRSRLDSEYPNGEGALRWAIQSKFREMFPDVNESCSSGWGVTEEMHHAISFYWSDDQLRKSIIMSYHDEGRPLPRFMRAWELLLAEEAKGKKIDKTKKSRKNTDV